MPKCHSVTVADRRRPPMAVVLARIRMPLIYLGLAAIAVDSFLVDLPRWPLLALLAVAFAVYLRLGTVRRPPVEVAPPVTGRWLAYNSPADRVPSHHLHAYGQTYAIDLVSDPAGGRRPGLAWWPLGRRPSDFPGFGQPVLAPADATVSRIDSFSRSPSATIPVGDRPEGLTIGSSAVWVANRGDDTVSRIDPTTSRVEATIRVGDSPRHLKIAGSSVWVPNAGDGTLSLIDTETNRTVGTPLRVGRGVTRVAVGFDSVWVLSPGTGTLTRVDPASL